MMTRKVSIIQYIDQSSWYTDQILPINKVKRKYKKGETIDIDCKKYIVIEDYGHLRVTRFCCDINPFKPMTKQIPHK